MLAIVDQQQIVMALGRPFKCLNQRCVELLSYAKGGCAAD
jgi:hypothetical protein